MHGVGAGVHRGLAHSKALWGLLVSLLLVSEPSPGGGT